jgi:hypothetical protein
MRNSVVQHFAIAAGLSAALLMALPCLAQDHQGDRDRDRGGDSWSRDWDANRRLYTRLEPGVEIPVRTDQPINVNRTDNRVFYGAVDADIRGDNGRIAIPRGSRAELMVRVLRDNDLVLDLESVVVNGQRYAVRTDSNHVEHQRDNSLVGAIVGAVSGGEATGPAVRIPRGAEVTFRLARPLEVGVVDRGVDRDGYHYHDWYRDDRDRQ